MSTAVSRRVSTLFVAVLLALAAIFTLVPAQSANAGEVVFGDPGVIENKYGGYTCKGFIQPGSPNVDIVNFQVDTWIQWLDTERRRVWVDPFWRSGYWTIRTVNVWRPVDTKFSRFSNSTEPHIYRHGGDKWTWEHYRHSGYAKRGKQVRCVMAGTVRAFVNGNYQVVSSSIPSFHVRRF